MSFCAVVSKVVKSREQEVERAREPRKMISANSESAVGE